MYVGERHVKKTQGEDGHLLQAKEKGLGRNQACPGLGPELLPSRKQRKDKFLLLKQPGLSYFVMAALAN